MKSCRWVGKCDAPTCHIENVRCTYCFFACFPRRRHGGQTEDKCCPFKKELKAEDVTAACKHFNVHEPTLLQATANGLYVPGTLNGGRIPQPCHCQARLHVKKNGALRRPNTNDCGSHCQSFVPGPLEQVAGRAFALAGVSPCQFLAFYNYRRPSALLGWGKGGQRSTLIMSTAIRGSG